MISEELFDICEVGEESIPLLRKVAWVVFPHTYRTMLSPEQIEYMMDMMYSERALLMQFRERGDRYFVVRRARGVAEEGEAADIVGYLSVRPDGDHCFHLEKLYTLPSVRGVGLGRRLFDYAKQVASEWADGEACRLILNVNRDNVAAVVFYHKMGMHEIGRGDFPIGQGYYMTDYILAIDIPAVTTQNKSAKQ